MNSLPGSRLPPPLPIEFPRLGRGILAFSICHGIPCHRAHASLAWLPTLLMVFLENSDKPIRATCGSLRFNRTDLVRNATISGEGGETGGPGRNPRLWPEPGFEGAFFVPLPAINKGQEFKDTK